jgi:hypothetical protein
MTGALPNLSAAAAGSPLRIAKERDARRRDFRAALASRTDADSFTPSAEAPVEQIEQPGTPRPTEDATSEEATEDRSTHQRRRPTPPGPSPDAPRPRRLDLSA